MVIGKEYPYIIEFRTEEEIQKLKDLCASLDVVYWRELVDWIRTTYPNESVIIKIRNLITKIKFKNEEEYIEFKLKWL